MQEIGTSWRGRLLSVLILLQGGLVACNDGNHERREWGSQSRLGEGEVTSFIDFSGDDIPTRYGVVFPASTLSSLPEHSDEHHCFDANDDGQIDAMSECTHSVERFIPLPGEASRRDEIPYRWVMFNWNSGGHGPPMIYDRPHFDVHFFIQPIEDVAAIEEGECGQGEPVRCDHYERATIPVPEPYMPAGYQSLGAVAPGMGNHLIDLSGPEFNGETFTRSFIYGAYDGQISFAEEMVSLDYLQSRPDACFPVAQAEAVISSAYYPTQSCIRYDHDRDEYSISLEELQYREAE